MADEPILESGELDSPGSILKLAREEQEISQREAADRLNWMPHYVAIIERDDYASLRRPSFARGYVKAFGRLLGVEEEPLMAAFDAMNIPATDVPDNVGKSPRSPMQLQKTGLGVIVGLGLLLILVLALWLWRGNIS